MPGPAPAQRLHPGREQPFDAGAPVPAQREGPDLDVASVAQGLEQPLAELAHAGTGPSQRRGVQGDREGLLGVAI